LEVDPHNAFGSKTAPVTMEVYSDSVSRVQAAFKTTNQLLMDKLREHGKGLLIHRDFLCRCTRIRVLQQLCTGGGAYRNSTR